MRFVAMTAATALALVATPALADEAKSFSGPYAGLLVGYDHVTLDSDSLGKGSKDGVAFGAVLGWDFDLGNAVVGAEGEISGSSAKEKASDVLTLGDSGELKAGRDIYVGVRAGFKVNPTVLVYAKGGYTNARATLKYNDGAGSSYSEGDNMDGFRLGAGVQYQPNRIGARIEYRYSDYGKYSYQGFATDISARRHQVVFTVVGKF